MHASQETDSKRTMERRKRTTTTQKTKPEYEASQATVAQKAHHHFVHKNVVLDRLNSFAMTVKITKCEFAASSLEFLGHELDSEGIRPSASHVKDIRNWPRPETVSDVQKFLGLTGYFRKFVKNYSDIASDLHALTHGTPFFYLRLPSRP